MTGWSNESTLARCCRQTYSTIQVLRYVYDLNSKALGTVCLMSLTTATQEFQKEIFLFTGQGQGIGTCHCKRFYKIYIR